MTPPPPLPPPPFGDDTDEALNALLDGELGAFAQARGLVEVDVRARLEHWPEYQARLAALEQVRAAVREPVPPLDDLDRKRLVSKALAAKDGTGATSKRTGRPWLRISAAAAAALVVLAGIGAMLTSLGTGGDSKSASSGSAATAGAPRGDVGNLGDVSDPATIRTLLDPGSASTSSRPSAPGLDHLRQQYSTGGTSDAAIAAGPDVPTPRACAALVAGSRPVRFFGTGTYQGRAVTIVGIDSGGRTIAFVVPRDDCTSVLTAVSR